MVSLRSFTTFASSLLSQVPLFSSPELLGNAPSCPIDGPLSCHNSTIEPDSCCFIHPGGQLLLTQFWDTNPTVGPDDKWTLHGLFVDHCDGTFPTYCDFAPQYHNITAIIAEHAAAGESSLIDDMETYWLPNRGTLEKFWQHEWNKHGTCVNTLSPSCYDSYSVGDEVVDFFQKTMNLFKTLDTYTALRNAGIVPSKTKKYSRQQVEDAVRQVTGHDVVLKCRGGRLEEAWYSFNVQGSLQDGEFVATSPVGKTGRSNCPQNGIKYVPK